MRLTKRFGRIQYPTLTARQKENFNFQKVSAVLADYGFATTRLSDDWNGADFIAQHLSGETLKVQLKSRFCVYRKYSGRDVWVTFPVSHGWYLFPHDRILEHVLQLTGIARTASWSTHGGYSWSSPPPAIRQKLEPYFLASPEASANGIRN